MNDDKLPKLTRKQALFVKELVNNPKLSGTEAAARAYNVANRNTAHTVASDNMRKPTILAHLAASAERAEHAVADIMEYSTRQGRKNAAYAGIGLSAANSLLDRVHGKATQRVETTSKAVVISIDLSRKALPDDIEEGELV